MKKLLIVTALIELGAGVALMAVPSAAVKLLLGSPLDAPAAMVLGRVAGAALFALCVACWLMRNEATSHTARALTVGMLFYNVAVAVILASAGVSSKLVGIALWPAVILRVVMAAWCVVCLWQKTSTKPLGTPRMTRS